MSQPISAGSRQEHWNTAYREKGENEVSWFETEPVVSLDLIHRSGATKSAAIIDIGGGASRLADRLSAEGYSDVTVLDISTEAIRRVEERRQAGGGARGIVADVTRWEAQRPYQIWHDRAALHFLVEEGDREAYRRNLLAALAPRGQAIIGTFAPSGSERCSGLPVRRYGAIELAAFAGAEFALVESFEVDHRTP